MKKTSLFLIGFVIINFLILYVILKFTSTPREYVNLESYIKDYSILTNSSSFKIPILSMSGVLKMLTVENGSVVDSETLKEDPSRMYFDGFNFKPLPKLEIKIEGGLLYATFDSNIILNLQNLKFDSNLTVSRESNCNIGERTPVSVDDYKRYNGFKVYNRNETYLPQLYFQCDKVINERGEGTGVLKSVLKKCPLNEIFDATTGSCNAPFSLFKGRIRRPKCFNGFAADGISCKDSSCVDMNSEHKTPFNTPFNFDKEIYAGYSKCLGGKEIVREMCNYSIKVKDVLNQFKISYPSSYFSFEKNTCVKTKLVDLGIFRIDGDFVYKGIEGTIGVKFFSNIYRRGNKYVFIKPLDMSNQTDKAIPIFTDPKSYILNDQTITEDNPIIVYKNRAYISPYSYYIYNQKSATKLKLKLLRQETGDTTYYATVYSKIIFDIVIVSHKTRINMKTFKENVKNMKGVILDDFHHYPCIFKYLLESHYPNFVYYNVKSLYEIDAESFEYDSVDAFFNQTFLHDDLKFKEFKEYLGSNEDNVAPTENFILNNPAANLSITNLKIEEMVKLINDRLTQIEEYVQEYENFNSQLNTRELSQE